MRNRTLASNLIKGAVAGAAATFVMERVTTWLYEREPEAVQTQESEARGGQSAYATAADSLAQAAGIELSERGMGRGGTAIHWATGIFAGMYYAAVWRHRPAAAGFGLPYATGMFVVLDEVLNPMLGLTPGPAAYPWQTHARGFAGHLAFGAINHATLKILDRAVPG